jgi:hypothetical protein
MLPGNCDTWNVGTKICIRTLFFFYFKGNKKDSNLATEQAQQSTSQRKNFKR